MIVQKHKKEGQKQVNLFLPFLFAASIGAALPIGARLCPDCTIYVRQVTAGDHVALPRGRLRPDCTICVRQVAAGGLTALPRGAYAPIARSACDKSLWEASHCSRGAHYRHCKRFNLKTCLEKSAFFKHRPGILPPNFTMHAYTVFLLHRHASQIQA